MLDAIQWERACFYQTNKINLYLWFTLDSSVFFFCVPKSYLFVKLTLILEGIYLIWKGFHVSLYKLKLFLIVLSV